MRPQTLDEILGQSHIIGPGKLLRRAIETDKLSSLIFWGQPRLRQDNHCFGHCQCDQQILCQPECGHRWRAGFAQDNRCCRRKLVPVWQADHSVY